MVRIALAVFTLLFSCPAMALEPGQPAPALSGQGLTGQPIDLASLKGKVVVVDFWATWCAPCRAELPILARLQRKYEAQGLVVIAVSVDSDEKKVRAFAKQLALSMPVIHDSSHAIADRYAPAKMPSSYVIDRKGRIHAIHAGFKAGDAAALEREIRQLLVRK